MNSPVNKALYAAATKILEPLIGVFVSHGAAYGTFEQFVRRAFVKAGFTHMERSGKRPTVSGIATLTGLSRKEVARLQQSDPQDDNASHQRYNRAVRVLSGWVNDTRFQCAGEPALLPIDGSSPNFSELVRDYSGDVPPVALLSVLQESGNVRVKNDTVELIERAYIPMQTEPDKLNILGTDVAELIHTVSHNISAEPGERLFQRKVSSTLLNKDDLDAFRAFSNERSQQLLEEYDEWLALHEVSRDNKDPDNAVYVAVGIYYSKGLI